VFLEHGGNSPYIEQVGSILRAVHEGTQRCAPFFATLADLGLLESFVLDVQLDDGSENRLAGFYAINEDALKDLAAEDLAMLNKRGYLEAIYMAIASMSHLPDLIGMKNLRRKLASTNV
jgi:hypothetical protein